MDESTCAEDSGLIPHIIAAERHVRVVEVGSGIRDSEKCGIEIVVAPAGKGDAVGRRKSDAIGIFPVFDE